MSEEIKELATKSLSKALEYIESAGDFVVEQAPLLVQEILAYGLVSNIVFATIYGAATAILCYTSYRLSKMALAKKVEELVVLVVLVGGAASITTIICFFDCILHILKIIFAPRLYLLEALKSLL